MSFKSTVKGVIFVTNQVNTHFRLHHASHKGIPVNEYFKILIH